MKLSVCQTFAQASLHPIPFKGVWGEIKNVSRHVTQPNSLPSESRFTPPRRRHNCASLSLMTPAGHADWISNAHNSLLYQNADTHKNQCRDQKSVAAAAPFLLFLFRKAILLSPDSPALLHWPIFWHAGLGPVFAPFPRRRACLVPRGRHPSASPPSHPACDSSLAPRTLAKIEIMAFAVCLGAFRRTR